MSERELIIRECINECRKLWYEENNIETEGMDMRQVGMHVGKKVAYTQCMNVLREMIEGKK